MPEPIPDTPEGVARAIFQTAPSDAVDWDCLKPGRDGYSTPKPPTQRAPE